MQFFHASRVLVLAAGLGLASTSSAAFIVGPSVSTGETASPVFVDLGEMFSGAQPGNSFESTMIITGPSGEITGQVTLAGTIDLVGQVNFVVGVTSLSNGPTDFSLFFSAPVVDPQQADGRAFTVASVLDATGDGATLSGNHEDGAMVHYLYTTGPDLGGGVLFDSQLLNDLVAGSLSTASASDESSPAPTFVPLSGVPAVLRAEVFFSITPHDQATLSGIFMLAVPSPATGAFGVAGLMMLGRRRRTN